MYRRNNGDWKSFQQQRKMFAGNFLWQYCKSKYVDFSCSMLIETSGERAMYFDQEASCVTIVASFLEKKEHKCLKSLQSSFCILHPACVLLSVCILQFALSLHFTPGPQSAVHSPQSSFYTDCILIYQERWVHNIWLMLCNLANNILFFIQYFSL